MKFAQNAKSIRQNYQENQIQNRLLLSEQSAKKLGQRAQIMDPESLRLLMQSQQ